MRNKSRMYYISDKTGGIRVLSKETSLSDIHRGIIFNNIDDINSYHTSSYGSIIDSIYYEDLFYSKEKDIITGLRKKMEGYKTVIENNKNRVYRYTNDLKYLNSLNDKYDELCLSKTMDLLELQEKLAIIWEEKYNREFSPFVSFIRRELSGGGSLTKDWREVDELKESWKEICSYYDKEIEKVELLYSNKVLDMYDNREKQFLYDYENKIKVIESRLMEIYYSMYFLNDYGRNTLLKTYSLDEVPREKILYDGYGYNLLIIYKDNIHRVRFIKESIRDKSYKLFTSDGTMFTNNIRLILDDRMIGETVKFKRGYSFHQTKTTENEKVKKIER